MPGYVSLSILSSHAYFWVGQGILKFHCTVDLLFDWFRFVCFVSKDKNVSCHRADSKPVNQEVNGTVILPPLVFPAMTKQPVACVINL